MFGECHVFVMHYNDFSIIQKIGKLVPLFSYQICLILSISIVFLTYVLKGTGAFSEVFKVSRKSDGKEYALKKVSLSNFSPHFKFQQFSVLCTSYSLFLSLVNSGQARKTFPKRKGQRHQRGENPGLNPTSKRCWLQRGFL